MIDFRDIRFGIGNAQDEGRDLSKSVIPFDASQNLTAVHLGHVEIEQNNIGTGRTGMVPLLLQERYCLNAIASHVHMEESSTSRKASCNSLTSPALSSTKRISKGIASGVDLTFATHLAASPRSECQTPNTTSTLYLPVVL